MGRVVLLWRLVTRDVRRHLPQAALLVVAIATAAAAFTMALALSGVTNQPYQKTRRATKGPDVVAYLQYPKQATALVHASGVVAHTGPYPIASATLHANGRTAGALVEGRTSHVVPVDQPLVTSGSWVRNGGVVLERTFAEALNVSVGDRITLNGHRFVVNGIAVTAAQPPYPNLCYFVANACATVNFSAVGPRDIGLVWATAADAVALTSASKPLSDYGLDLKLSDPRAAVAFTERVSGPGPGSTHHLTSSGGGPGPGGPPPVALFATSNDVSTSDALLVQDAQSVLVPGSILLALLAIASVAVLVGRRLSEYSRRVGLLKAVGATPLLVAATFLTENLLLALLAAGIGLVVGWLAAPLLTSPGAALIGLPGAPSVTVVSVLEVVGVALVVAMGATVVPAVRAARSSTVRALVDGARSPRRRGILIRLSRRFPVPVLFGLRLVARRPRRALLTAANMAVTVTGLVAVISFHASADARFSAAVRSGMIAGGLSDPVINRDEQMLAVVTVMLVALAVLNAIFTTSATVRDARQASALFRALGARPGQVSGGLTVAQLLSALPGAIVGVALGFGLSRAAINDNFVFPPLWWVFATVIGALVAIVVLTLISARFDRAQPVAEILQAEAA